MVGKKITHYKILEKLGAGGMGSVYKAMDLKLDRVVALKFLNQELLQDDEARHRFIREAKIISNLDHPNIATVYEIDEFAGSLFISMSYCEGQTLKQYLAQGPLAVREVCAIGIQIAEGLAEAHRAEVIHRDVKPANIFLSAKQQVKILAFGLAKSRLNTEITEFGTQVGTAAYMSPEQATGRRADHRSDLFSLGVILYEMFSGKKPFTGEYGPAILYSIVHDEPEPIRVSRSEVPTQVENLLSRTLAKEPADRYQSAEEMLDDLKAVHDGDTATSVTSKLTGTFSFPKHRWRPVGGLAGLVLILSLLMLVVKPNEPVNGGIESIAIMPFSYTGDEENWQWLGRAMTDLVSTNLAEYSSLRVLGARQRSKIIKAHGLQDSLLNKAQALQIANEAEMNSVLLGDLKKIGDTIRVQSQVFETASGKLVAVVMPFESTYSQLDEAALNVSSNLVNAFNFEEENLPSTRVATRMPSSIEALRYYIEGTDAAYDLRYEEAVEKLTKVISLDSTFIKAYYLLAWQYNTLGNKGKAMQVLAKGRPYISHLSLEKRLKYLSEEAKLEMRWKDFTSYLERLIMIRPQDARLRYSYGMVQYQHFRQLDVGISALQKALQLDSTYSSTYNSLGYAYLAKGDKDKALEMFQNFISQNPSDVNPLASMAEALEYIGHYDKAIEYCERIMDIESDFPHTPLFLARAYLARGKYAKADVILEKHIRNTKHPKYKSRGLSLQAEVYFLRSEFEQALATVAAAIALDSTNLRGHWLRGRVLLRFKDENSFKDELDLLNLALSRKGSLKDRWLWHHLQGEAALQIHDFENAIESFQMALNLAPLDRSFYLSSLANAYEQSGQLGKALNHYNYALAFNPNNALANFQLARTYEKSDKTSEALAAYTKVLEVWSDADRGITQLVTARNKIATGNSSLNIHIK